MDQRVAVSNTATRAGEQQELRIKYIPSGKALGVSANASAHVMCECEVQ